MAFTRTTSGLRNQHLFHKVDIVMYVEGGISFSLTEVIEGAFSNDSIDSLFWNQIFTKLSTKKIKFKPIGSKNSVSKIAQLIIDKNLTTVYSAMDQEFDMIYNLNFSSGNVLYTHGYSWENDVWNEKVIRKVINILSANSIDKNIVNQHFKKFLKEIKYSVYADGYLFGKSSSFFPRPGGHLKLVECDINLETKLKHAEIATIINNKNLKKSTIYSFGNRKNIEVKRNCYGHLLGDFCSKLIQFILKKYYSLSGIKTEFIRRIAITIFFDYISVEVRNHYDGIVN